MKMKTLWIFPLVLLALASCKPEVIGDDLYWRRDPSIACYLNGEAMYYDRGATVLAWSDAVRALKCPASLEIYGTTVVPEDPSGKRDLRFTLTGPEELTVNWIVPKEALGKDVVLTDAPCYLTRKKDKALYVASEAVLVLHKNLMDGEFSLVVETPSGTLFLTNGQFPRIKIK